MARPGSIASQPHRLSPPGSLLARERHLWRWQPQLRYATAISHGVEWDARRSPYQVRTGPLALLGLNPVLPDWLPELVVRGLRVGGATVSLHFRRDRDGRTDWDVLHKSGTLRIVRQPPPEAGAGVLERLGALVS